MSEKMNSIKKWISVLLLIDLAVLMTFTTVVPTGKNYIKNPAFEDQLDFWSTSL